MLEDGVLRRWVFGPPTRKKPPRRTERGFVGGGIASRIPPEREVRIIRLQVHYSIYLPVESSEFRSANYLVRRLIPRKVVRFAIFFFREDSLTAGGRNYHVCTYSNLLRLSNRV